MDSSRPSSPRDTHLALLLAVTTILLYELTAVGHPTPFDYYSRLADAFAHGRAWLTEAPSYLVELVPCASGGLCSHLPPLPALLVLPFTTTFAGPTAQTLASAILGGAAAGPVYLSLRRLGAPLSTAALVTVFAMIGTDLYFTSADGRSWYLSHAAGVLFASLALLLALDGRPGWVVGVALGAAALSRFPLALAAPGLALLVARVRGGGFPRALALLVAGALPFAAAEAAYDLVRFGTVTETGYAALAEGDPYFPYGLLSLAYVPRHLYAILFQAPVFVDGAFAFVKPSRLGESVLLVSPAFLFALGAIRHRRAEVLPLVLAGALPLGLDVLHGTTGFTQFGYRYLLDAQPFLLPLVAIGASWTSDGWTSSRRPLVVAIAYSIVANVYGAIAIIRFGYW